MIVIDLWKKWLFAVHNVESFVDTLNIGIRIMKSCISFMYFSAEFCASDWRFFLLDLRFSEQHLRFKSSEVLCHVDC